MAYPGKYFPLKQMIENGMKPLPKEKEKEEMLKELSKTYGEEAVRKALVKLIESVNDDGKEAKWTEKEFAEAKELEITDGTNPEMFATCQEVAVMVKRALSQK